MPTMLAMRMLRVHALHRGFNGVRFLNTPARHAHSPAQQTAVEKHAIMLTELQATLQDAAATERLSALISSSTAENLAKAIAAVKRENQARLAETAASASAAKATVSMQELKYVALQVGIPFVGFGFIDNVIMIIAGDYIDMTLGISLGISSMAAAGIGNTISDVAGLGLGGVVEDFCARLGLPTPSLTPAQMMLRETRIAKVAGSSIGVTIGCLLGMAPLLFMETRNDVAEPTASPANDASSPQLA